jgi:hypothetical protein
MRTLFLILITCLFVLPAYAKYSGGTGEPNDPYQIATAEDLILLGETPEDCDKHFILTADIDLDPNLPGRKVFDSAVIAPDKEPTKDGFQGPVFTGIFDGNGHVISNLTVAGKDYAGLFGQFGRPRGMVKNVGVVDVKVTGSGYSVGGLVGGNGGTVTDCYSTASVSGTGWYVGGLVGGNGGTVTYCYCVGAVSGTGHDVGGLVGSNFSFQGSMTGCFWDTQTSGQATGSGGTGKTTAEMQTASIFLGAGWDLLDETTNGTDDIWWINEGQDYPHLWWELIDEN